MKKLVLYVIAVYSVVVCSGQQNLRQYYIDKAQECGGVDELMKKKGEWKRHEDVISNTDQTFPRSQFGQLNTRMNNFLPLMKEANPQPGGIEPRWYRSIGGSSIMSNGPVAYRFTALYFNYYCNTNLTPKQVLLGEETGTWAYIFVNHFNWFFSSYDEWDINNDGKPVRFYNTSPKVGEWKGYPLYEPYAHGEYCRAVLLTHDGGMPWQSLTQKQYLTGLKNLVEMKKKQANDQYDRQEEEMKKRVSISPTGVSQEVVVKIKTQNEKMLKDFQEKKEGYKAKNNVFFDEKLKHIYDYLANNSEETLSQTAIIDPKYGIEGFKGQFGDEQRKGTRLVRIAGKYFKKDLPRYVPQLMLLYWRWSEEPPSLNFKKQFEENFPVEKLKAMLDK